MQELKVGGLTFSIEYRTDGGDRGPAVRVFADSSEGPRQVLRFDCFEIDPHYHYDPTGVNRKYRLDRLTMGCPIDFTLAQIDRRMAAMIAAAGFDDAAGQVDQEAISARLSDIRAAIDSAISKTP